MEAVVVRFELRVHVLLRAPVGAVDGAHELVLVVGRNVAEIIVGTVQQVSEPTLLVEVGIDPVKLFLVAELVVHGG